MGPVVTIKANPIADDALSYETAAHFMQIHRFIFERTPEPFNNNIVKV